MITDQLGRVFGLEFPPERLASLNRAVLRRLKTLGQDGATEAASSYGMRISTDRGELDALAGEATNNLTRFFRNASQICAIREYVVPRILSSNEVTTWVAGCSTGEEAYSLAAVLADSGVVRYTVRATDISSRALETGRSARYPEASWQWIPVQMRTYFRAESGTVTPAPEVRERVEFARHNVLERPPATSLHLVLMRNVLTYLTNQSQARAIRRAREALREGGVLLVGNSEHVARTQGFEPIRVAGATVYVAV